MEVCLPEQILWSFIKECLQKQPGLNGGVLRSILNTTHMECHFSKGKRNFTLKVPSSLHQNLIRSLLPNIQKHIQQKGMEGSVTIEKDPVFLSSLPNPKLAMQKTNFLNTPTSYSGQTSQPSFHKLHSHSSNGSFSPSTENFEVFSEWDFESLVEGPGNCLAIAAAKNIANHPRSRSINPLFIYGASGLGKTHILLSIGNFIRKQNLPIKVSYLSAERFFNDCIFHIQKNSMSAFREKYRKHVHILLLDDVQILGRGERTQEEFFHTFESLIQKKCQIVLASDKKPKDIKGLKARICSRFAGGMVVDIKAPDPETKMAIIKNKSKKINLPLSEQMIHYLTQLPADSVREIEGNLNKIKFFCDFQKTNPSLEIIKKLLPSSYSHRVISLTTQQIQNQVAHYFHIKVSDLISPLRSQKLVYARNIAIFLVREELNLSLHQIGRDFGQRDHSSILKALKKIKTQIKKNSPLENHLKSLKKTLSCGYSL